MNELKNGRNPFYDTIIELVKSIKSEEETVVFDGRKWGAPAYLLGVIIRQYQVPVDHYFVSAEAKKIWDSITDENIFYYAWQDQVECRSDGITVTEYTGNKKDGIDRPLKRGDKVTFRRVFHDEHIVPVKAIVDWLCSLPKVGYDDIRKAFSSIYICKILKGEDKKLINKFNRPFDYRQALIENYQKANIELYQANFDGTLVPYSY